MIPFQRPYTSGLELSELADALSAGLLGGGGARTRRCERRLEQGCGVPRALLTTSCTAALEMAALLIGVEPGNEVILPSYTFPSTANAFARCGGVPVFVDIRDDTLNIDEEAIESAITPRTRAIVPVHYAGVACAMDRIGEIAMRHGLHVIEDAAQAFGARFDGRPLGSLGSLGCLSFHATKNLQAGECGALLLGDPRWAARAEVLRDKGTNRGAFLRGEVDRYAWCDVGSAYAPSELVAAFLSAQLQHADEILSGRMAVWNRYHDALVDAERDGLLRRPRVPEMCGHNAHLYYVLLPTAGLRAEVWHRLQRDGVETATHYVPLHDTPTGRRVGRVAGSMQRTEDLSSRLLRLPMWIGVDTERVVQALLQACHGAPAA